MTDPIEEIRDALVEDGFEPESVERLVRLMKCEPTDAERRRWEEVGIMEDGKILIGEDEMKDFSTIVLGLWDLCYEGKIQRVEGK